MQVNVYLRNQGSWVNLPNVNVGLTLGQFRVYTSSEFLFQLYDLGLYLCKQKLIRTTIKFLKPTTIDLPFRYIFNTFYISILKGFLSQANLFGAIFCKEKNWRILWLWQQRIYLQLLNHLVLSNLIEMGNRNYFIASIYTTKEGSANSVLMV